MMENKAEYGGFQKRLDVDGKGKKSHNIKNAQM